ncbi:MAG: PIN-like domain-containing protein [Acidimicrobiales bacterium]
MLAGLRSDVTYPGDPGAVIHKRMRPPCSVTSPRSKDPEWIRLVSAQRLLIITRDSNIHKHAAGLEAVRAASGRLVALSSADAGSTWGQLEVVMNQWRRFEADREVGTIYLMVSGTQAGRERRGRR